MLFMNTYRITGDRTPERIGALMKVFGERGEAEGTVAHYVHVDGGGGWIIQDTTDMLTAYETSLAYSEWLEIESVPVITVEEAVPKILDYLS